MPLIPCWRTTVSMYAGLIPLQRFPRQIGLGLHVMDRVHFDVLIGFVERDASCDPEKILGRGQPVADRLSTIRTALDHVGDQHDLVVGMSVEMCWVAIEFTFEPADKIAVQRPLIRRVELHDPNIANRGLAGLLFETKWQPDRAKLDRFAAAAFDNAGLH